MNWRSLLKTGGIVIGVLAVGAVGFVIWFLFLFSDYTDTEIARYPDPSRSVEAVVVERSGNATVPLITMVYIVARGGKPAGEQRFLADHVDGLAISWIDDKTVRIHAENARVSNQPVEATVDGKVLNIGYEIVNAEKR